MGNWLPEPGLLIADRFRLVRELGRGGMGQVWVAYHEGLDIECALKFIVGDAGAEELRSRFRQEARAAAKLRSRHVVQMLDHGMWQDTPYIAMELLRGEPLSLLLDRRRKLDPAEAIAVARDVGNALTAAAELGIVHRDLKPENVFIAQDGKDKIAKVLDFGIAKSTRLQLPKDHRTRTGSILGTPHYMSPEQLDGTLPIDPRSDLWSLAVIVFECLIGKLPFDEETLPRLITAIMQRPVPVPSAVDPLVPAGFDAWWLKSVQREPNDRFQSALEMVDALAEALADAPHSDNDEPTMQRHVSEVAPRVQETLASVTHAVKRPPSIDDPPTLVAGESPARTAGGTLVAGRVRTQLHDHPGTFGGQAAPSFRERRRRVLVGSVVAGALAVSLGVWAVSRGDAPTASLSATPEASAPASIEPEPEPTAAAAEPSAAAEAESSPEPVASATAEPTATATAERSSRPPPVRRPPPRRPKWK
jgi:serine/threonine-protein kinase